MLQPQQTLNPWLVSYISQHHKTQTRYEIDRYLLETGYEASKIEAAWQSFETASVVELPKPQKLVWLNSSLVIISTFLIILLLINAGFLGVLYFPKNTVLILFPACGLILLVLFLLRIKVAKKGYILGKRSIVIISILLFFTTLYSLTLIPGSYKQERLNASAAGHDYRLIEATSCFDICIKIAQLYRCEVFNTVCHSIGLGMAYTTSSPTKIETDIAKNKVYISNQDELMYTYDLLSERLEINN